MWTLIEPFLGYLVSAIVAILGLLGYGKHQRKKGRKEAEAQQENKRNDSIRRANENREKVSSMDDGAQLDEFERLYDLRNKRPR